MASFAFGLYALFLLGLNWTTYLYDYWSLYIKPI